MAALLTIDEALELIFEHARPLPAEQVTVADAVGRVLRESVSARVDLPPFPSSAMDGYAVCARDTPGELPIAFRVAAGSPAGVGLPQGMAAGISTGAFVPDGADSVVPVEVVEVRDGSVVVPTAVETGQHVRPRGGDVAAGDVVVDEGARLRPAQIGSLAAVGVSGVPCAVRPRVAVLATGSELRAAGAALAPGQIYESNGVMLAALLGRVGAEVERMPIVEDSASAHEEALARGLEADVLVTSGGVSVGEHDLVRRTLASLGVEEVFWGVAVKPGKPLSFGVRGATLVFGLPGNPVSALVCALLFVTPALLARQGAADPRTRYLAGRTTQPLRRNAQRDEYLRAVARADADGTWLEPIRGQESHMIGRTAVADSLVHVPQGEGDLPEGSVVRFVLI